jgi:hypothetical protein
MSERLTDRDLARLDVPGIGDDVRMMARELIERRNADEELAVMHREYASLEAHHAAVVAQRNKDWDALMVEIALTVGDRDDREAAEMGEIEEFDPWHALRTFRSRRALDLTSEDVDDLRWLQTQARAIQYERIKAGSDGFPNPARAIALLDRLTAKGGG